MHQQTIRQQLEEIRRSEVRSCGQCGYRVDNPFCERCPRCNRVLPKLQLHCAGCIVNSVCPAAKLAGEAPPGDSWTETTVSSGEYHGTHTRKSDTVL